MIPFLYLDYVRIGFTPNPVLCRTYGAGFLTFFNSFHKKMCCRSSFLLSYSLALQSFLEKLHFLM